MKIKHKLIYSFTILLLLPCLAIGGLSFLSAKASIENELIGSAKGNINILNSMIDSTINAKLVDTDYFSKAITASLYEGEESPLIIERLDMYAAQHPEVKSTYVGTQTGLMIQAPDQQLPEGYDPRKRPWYQEAMAQKGQPVITEPYVDAGSGEIVVSIAQMTADGSGVVGLDLDLKSLAALVQQVKIGNAGYSILLDQTGKVLVHPTAEIGTEATESWLATVLQQSSGELDYEIEGQAKRMAFITNERTGWKLAGTMYASEVDEAAQSIFDRTLLVIAVAILVGAILVYAIIRSINRPLVRLVEAANQVSQGDLSQQIAIKGNDELAQLGKSFNAMIHSLQSVLSGVQQTVEKLASSSEELSASSEQTTRASENITSAIQQVAGGAELQSKGAQESAVSLVEMSHGIQRIAENASLVSEAVKHTSRQAEEGGGYVQQTVTQIRSIHGSVHESSQAVNLLIERSNEISNIAEAITGISSQTNLLALNAAIEAARAGEHGRGFSVVADEVRKLAEQSAESAQQIANLIEEIQRDTKRSFQAMDQVKKEVESGLSIVSTTEQSFQRILASMSQISGKVQEAAGTAEQIFAGAQQITASVTAMSQVSEETSASCEEVSASAEEQLASMEEISTSVTSLAETAEELREMIGKFKM